jgi:protein SMG6
MSMSPRRPNPRTPRKTADKRASLAILPGYTILVIDTNILLSSLSMFASVIESLRWTVIVPLPVVMELDGLSKTSASSAPQLIEAAQSALAYLSSHVRSHSMSLKIQTSKGNYLTSLSVRTEHIDFDASGNWERNMDDLILKAAIWQDEHWVDRSTMLRLGDFSSSSDRAGAIKVVLLSLDRNRQLFYCSPLLVLIYNNCCYFSTFESSIETTSCC